MLTPEWRTAHGETLRLSAMTSAHLRNAAEYIRRGTGEYGPLVGVGARGFTYEEWRLLMATELARRARAGRE